MKTQECKPRQHEAVAPDRLYTLEQLKQTTGLGTASFRELRRRGLPVKYACGRAFVLGRDFIQAISEGKAEKDAKQ